MTFFGVSMQEIIEAVQYVSRFFSMETSSAMPIVIKTKKEAASVNKFHKLII
jgi:hypothetical protein